MNFTYIYGGGYPDNATDSKTTDEITIIFSNPDPYHPSDVAYCSFNSNDLVINEIPVIF